MSADKKEVAAYFDRLSEDWDESLVHDDAVIEKILNFADIRPGVHVLDVACGTGVLFQDYLDRGVSSITGVDLSSGMIAQAQKKFQQPNVHLVRADIQACRFDAPFDRCMIYNALPHFEDPAMLLRRLAGFLVPGGRLTVAHSMSREQIDAHHQNHAQTHSKQLPEAELLAQEMRPWFDVDVMVSDNEKYVVSGVRNTASLSSKFSDEDDK